MKANYNRKINVREKAVAFRARNNDDENVFTFCLIQNTLYGRTTDDRDIVYLDFENPEQIDKLINTLQDIKNKAYPDGSETDVEE